VRGPVGQRLQGVVDEGGLPGHLEDGVPAPVRDRGEGAGSAPVGHHELGTRATWPESPLAGR
jgi:hypothetical protein